MCVELGLYPLVKLDTGKRKVLLNYGVVIENRDFEHLNQLELEWRLAIHNKGIRENFNYAVKRYGITDFEKFVNVPCGKCEQCLKSKARGWAYRILKEAEQYENNYFITLTYDDEHLPVRYIKGNYVSTLIKNEISDFNKKLKTYLKRRGLNSDFRFYGIGEYGSNTFRSHYHVIYFNLDLPDDLEFYKYEKGNIYFKSEFLNSVWSKGFVVIGALDIGSACYVARYCDKKLERSDSEKTVFTDFDVQPEFSVMSRRPGIGSYMIDKIIDNIKNKVYSLSARGNDFSIPIYYSKKIKELLPDHVLKDYEAHSDMLIKNKINRDLLLSDILGTDRSLQSYYIEEDIFKKSCKRQRDIL